MTKESLFLLCLLKIFLTYTLGDISYQPLPGYLYECFEKHTKIKAFDSEPAIRIAESCLNNYAWRITGVKCNTVSQSTRDYIGGLLLPYIDKKHYRHKRQAGVRIRKEVRAISAGERQAFFNALTAVWESGRYAELSNYHGELLPADAHGSMAFLPWHRIYIYLFEDALREVDQSVTLPYWNSNLDANMDFPTTSIIWSDDFFSHESGRFSGWGISRSLGEGRLITTPELRNLNAQTDAESFSFLLEGLHNGVHTFVGGDMDLLQTAARDPIFYLHHSYVDYLWWSWQMANQDQNFPWEFPIANLRSLTDSFEINETTRAYTREWANRKTYEASPIDCSNLCSPPYYRCQEGRGCRSVSRDEVVTRKKRDVWGRPAPGFGWVHPGHFNHPGSSFHARMNPYPPMHISQTNGRPHTAAMDRYQPIPYQRHTSQTTWSPFQNTFYLDCRSDYRLWVYIPVRVIQLQPPGVKYNSYLVSHGRIDYHSNVYSDTLLPKNTSYTKSGDPTCFERCDENKMGVSRITVRSDGLNYIGIYKEYAIMDSRPLIDEKIIYIAVRRPDKKKTKVVLTAHDECGRNCIPKCLVQGSNPPRYISCSGVLNIDSKIPYFYGNSYGDAVLNYWSMSGGDCPFTKEFTVHVVFYCNYKDKWFPWTGCAKSKTHKRADQPYKYN